MLNNAKNLLEGHSAESSTLAQYFKSSQSGLYRFFWFLLFFFWLCIFCCDLIDCCQDFSWERILGAAWEWAAAFHPLPAILNISLLSLHFKDTLKLLIGSWQLSPLSWRINHCTSTQLVAKDMRNNPRLLPRVSFSHFPHPKIISSCSSCGQSESNIQLKLFPLRKKLGYLAGWRCVLMFLVYVFRGMCVCE